MLDKKFDKLCTRFAVAILFERLIREGYNLKFDQNIDDAAQLKTDPLYYIVKNAYGIEPIDQMCKVVKRFAMDLLTIQPNKDDDIN